jgi:hypothetical protein
MRAVGNVVGDEAELVPRIVKYLLRWKIRHEKGLDEAKYGSV